LQTFLQAINKNGEKMSEYNWKLNVEAEDDPWYKYICEYYDVSHSQAIKLGTRSNGRKPDLPGSPTCEPLNNMTYEDIWALSERSSEEDVFKFYVDQGAWSSFRQTVRHSDMLNFHRSLFKFFSAEGKHVCSYGCGVAPFLTTLLLEAGSDINVDISLSDVEGAEHFIFADWKLKQIAKERNMKNVNIVSKPISVGTYPTYNKPIDLAIVFEVLEHVPSPLGAITNICEQMNKNGLLLENFIKHDHEDDEDDGPDLKSAVLEREAYYDFLRNNYDLVAGSPNYYNENQTRVWKKK
jgi:hypothetical protein